MREVQIDPADLGKIWKAFDATPSPWPTIYRLLVLCGCRRADIQGLQWHEVVDLDGTDPRLELGSRSKAGKKLARVIVLTPMAADLLRAVPRHPGAFVFGGDRPLPDYSGADAKVREAAGSSYYWSVQGFRALLATWLHEREESADAIRGVLGQRIQGALAHYLGKPPKAAMRSALLKWSKFVEEAIAKQE